MTKYEKRRIWNNWKPILYFVSIMLGFAIFASMDAIIGRLT